MQSMQPLPGKARLFVMPSSEKEPRKLVLRGLVCPAVNLSRVARCQHMRACLLCARSVKSCTTSLCASRFRTPSTVSGSQPFAAGLFCMQSTRGRWRDSQPGNAAWPSMAQRNPGRKGFMQRETTPNDPVHAAPGRLCKFAQNCAVKALQIRPISTTRDTLQELYTAISNGLAAFQSTAGNAAQCSPDRPPGVDPLRLYAVGAKFS